jgi:hypothetical protein
MSEWKPRQSPRYRLPEGPQNRSAAVMAQRAEPVDSLDDFPTPRWATRALLNELSVIDNADALSCWEPTCGRGFMAATLAEYFATVRASDISPFGYGEELDFLGVPTSSALARDRPDWIVTNPPFRLAEEFARRSLALASKGAAMLVRTGFIEGAGRFRRLFEPNPPAYVAQFVERVPISRGRVDPKASTATSYCWLIWKHGSSEPTRLLWVPPCRGRLERPFDYNLPIAPRPEVRLRSLA